MKVEIYHQINPTLREGETGALVKVATLETDFPVEEALEEAFRLTSHIDEPWWWQVGHKRLQPEPGPKRSSMLGDIAVATDGDTQTTWQLCNGAWQRADPDVLKTAVDVRQTQARGQEPPDRGSGWRSRGDKGRGGRER